jgi:hypothetical protein
MTASCAATVGTDDEADGLSAPDETGPGRARRTVKRREPFAMVPEWILDAEISDRAKVLFAILDRYIRGNPDGCRLKRSEIARRMRCSEDTVDRALAELDAIAAVRVQANTGAHGRKPSTYRLWPFVSEVRADAESGIRLDAASQESATTRSPSSLLERKRPAHSQANGAPWKGTHPEGEKILREFYESRQPRPVIKNWPQATRMVGRYLDEGYPPARIRAALVDAPNVSIGCINVALDKLAKSGPVSPFTVGGRDPHRDQDRYDPTVDIDPNDPHRRDERSW